MLPDQKITQAVHLDEAFLAGADMSAKKQEILSEIVSRTGFSPKEVLQRSSYWGTGQIGAVHYLGQFENKPAVLKIQGAKPEISEIFMIQQFAAQNRSRTIRPPHLYATIPWDDSKGYEALIMEHVTGDKVLRSKMIQTREDISKFLGCYQEYRENCLPRNPWLPKPERLDPDAIYQQLIKASERAYPDHPFRQPQDKDLAIVGAGVLAKVYEKVSLEFVQSHFSVEDLIYQGEEIVMFSNLFWKWRFPFYDAVFGYHWFMYELANVADITPSQIEEQRSLWLEEISNLPQVKNLTDGKRLLRAALLERAIAGLLIDSFLVDRNKPIAEYLTSSTRDQVKVLTTELS